MGRRAKPDLTTTKFFGLNIRRGEQNMLHYLRVNMQEFGILLSLNRESPVLRQLIDSLKHYRDEHRLITAISLSDEFMDLFDAEVYEMVTAFAGEAYVSALFTQNTDPQEFNLR